MRLDGADLAWLYGENWFLWYPDVGWSKRGTVQDEADAPDAARWMAQHVVGAVFSTRAEAATS